MSFRPGCHRPFHRSYRLRSLPLLSQDCVLSSFGSVFLLLLSPDIVLQHVLTSTVVTLRPFALSLYSWRILFLRKVRGSNPRVIADLLLSRELPYHSANLPIVVSLAVSAQGSLRPYFPQTPLSDEPVNLVLRICPRP